MPNLVLIDEKTLLKAVKILKKGGIIAYPTETFYGLGVDAINKKSVERLYKLKERDTLKPIPILIGNLSMLGLVVKEIPEVAEKLIKRFWPGPLTIIFYASTNIPSLLTANTQKIGVRISSNPIAQKILKLFASPITATSANISLGISATSPKEIIDYFGDKVDMILDGEKLESTHPSTVIDITVSPPQIVREGIIPRETIEEYLWQR